MSTPQTAKYIKTQIYEKSHHPEYTSDPIRLVPHLDFGAHSGVPFNLQIEIITKPFMMVEDHHNHPFDQYLTFLGGDINNNLELNAEIELVLSEDGIHKETHVITKATSIFIPKGLYHCPLIYKRVDKPFYFIEIFFADQYTQLKRQ